MLHLSDTHGKHRLIERRFPLPSADILIHTGDWSDRGTVEESQDFNAWLGEVKHKYKHIVVIAGNHEWSLLKKAQAQVVEAAFDPKGFISGLLTNASHVLDHEGVTLMGLNIFGSAWVPGAMGRNPDEWDPRAKQALADQASQLPLQARRRLFEAERFDLIPPGTDVLLTHGPPAMIFDRVEGSNARWGSSEQLLRAILQKSPAAHLFGHLHEQRGVWHRPSRDAAWAGGVEYQRKPGEAFPTWPPPSLEYPCSFVSCNAMANHPGLEGAASHIAGPGRLIVATPRTGADGRVVRKESKDRWEGASNIDWQFHGGEAAVALAATGLRPELVEEVGAATGGGGPGCVVSCACGAGPGGPRVCTVTVGSLAQ